MLPTVRSVIFSKKALLTYALELALLAVSVYGFGVWRHYPYAADEAVVGVPLLSLVFLGVVPLIVFILVALRKAVGLAGIFLSASFQLRIDELQKRLNEQDDFFRLINDASPLSLTIYDAKNEYWFVNASAARELGVSGSGVLGKKPVDVLGIDLGRRIERNLEQTRNGGAPLEILTQEIDREGMPRYRQTTYHPVAPLGGFPGGVMARDENVTTLVIERQRRENMLRQVISTLIAVVDRRDPYAAGHSARVGQLSRLLASDMQLDERAREAAEIAGSLMNFGKVLISRSILTKTENLTPEELQRVRDGILTSAEILSLIDFGSPVVPTLSQVLERFDGTGAPAGLAGAAILTTARIVAVANAFVALVSPRAYRAGISPAVALQRLARDAGTAFDPAVVAALERMVTKDAAKMEWLAGKPV